MDQVLPRHNYVLLTVEANGCCCDGTNEKYNIKATLNVPIEEIINFKVEDVKGSWNAVAVWLRRYNDGENENMIARRICTYAEDLHLPDGRIKKTGLGNSFRYKDVAAKLSIHDIKTFFSPTFPGLDFKVIQLDIQLDKNGSKRKRSYEEPHDDIEEYTNIIVLARMIKVEGKEGFYVVTALITVRNEELRQFENDPRITYKNRHFYTASLWLCGNRKRIEELLENRTNFDQYKFNAKDVCDKFMVQRVHPNRVPVEGLFDGVAFDVTSVHREF